MGPMCLSLLCLVPLRIMVFLTVLALISTEWVTAQSMHSSKELRDILFPLARFADLDNHVKTLSEAVGMATSRITSVEQTVNALSAKMASFAALEQNVSTLTENVNSLTVHAYARLKRMQRPSPVVPTRQDCGTYLDIVTAPQPLGPLGPMAQGHLMTVEILGVDLILSQAPKMNKHEVPSYYGSHANNTQNGITIWINNLWEESNMPAYSELVRNNCKAGSVSVRLAFETGAKCQDFVARYKDDGIPYEINNPFYCAKTTITVRQSKSLEDREVGKQFAPLWRIVWPTQNSLP